MATGVGMATVPVKASDLVFDSWTPASFKRVLGNKTVASDGFMAPTWVGEHARRLTAYKILQSYVDNVSRLFLQEIDPERMENHREYGDASLAVEQILSALIGEDQTITTEGAPNVEPNPGEGQQQTNQQQQAAWKLQEWLRKWATDERLPIKMIENERNGIIFGDGVYTLGWDPDKDRVRLRVFDPGFYFPVLSDVNEDEYPERVHVAWELETDEPGVHKLRRITWELAPLDSPKTFPGEERSSRVECVMSDGVWTINLTGRQKVDDLTEASVQWNTVVIDGESVPINKLPIGVSFIPVVHIPNTVSHLNHYGKSSLITVLQILDDIANADTDLQAASATTGTPPIALIGGTLGANKPKYRPGEVWELGKEGKLDALDTSKSLDALLKYIDALLSRLSVNIRLPESVMGRVKPSEVPSGIALALSFGPMTSMINQMRLVRNEKYRLLFKFVWKMARAAGAGGVPDQWIESSMSFGPFLPNDKQAAVDMVNKLLNIEHPAISLETAVTILMVAGLPIEDAMQEVSAISGRDFTGAQELWTATGSREAVFEYLDKEMPDDVGEEGGEPPVVQPPVGAQGGGGVGT
jgi:hypothetical protein